MMMRCFALLSVAVILATAAPRNGRAGGNAPARKRPRATHTPTATSIASKKPAAQKAWKPQKPKVASRSRASRFGPTNAGKQQRVKTGHAAASFEDRTFAIMDSNRDGKITGDEVEVARSMLSEELSAGHLNDTVRKRLSTALSSFDVMRVDMMGLDMDRDGILSKREWRGMTAFWREQSAKGWKDSAFKFMDTNGDGQATRAERGNALRALRKMRNDAEHVNEKLRDGHRRLLAFLEKSDGKFNVRSFDENSDGVLKLDEFLGGPKTVSKALPTESGRLQHRQPQPATPVAKGQVPQSMSKRPATRDSKSTKGVESAKSSKDWRHRAFAFLDRNADLAADVHEIGEAHAALRRDKAAGFRLPMEQLWLLRHLDGDSFWRARADQNGDGLISLDELVAYSSSNPVSRGARDGNHASDIEL